MMTLRRFETGKIDASVPMNITWYLSAIGEAKGRQDLFARQSPQRLKVLREHALAESVISSNRIEGVEIDRERVGSVVFGRPSLRDRNEQEVGGYRDALNWIHSEGAKLGVSEKTILRLHRLSRGEIWDAGKYKNKPVDIIETFPDGGRRIRFRSVSPAKTPAFMKESLQLWEDFQLDQRLSPLIALAALNLDFLCIHPFRDGNGRVSRLLLLLTCYHIGIEVGRFISLEQLIEENKDRYLETLEQSSKGWHEGRHDPWPYIGFLLYIIKKAYDRFTERAGDMAAVKGEKAELVLRAIRKQSREFQLVDIEQACPGVGRDWIRTILFGLKDKGKASCSGKGRAARWRYKGD